MQWKSLDAYNYIQSGHFRDVRLFRLPSTQSCVMTALVNPSQNAPDKAHHILYLAWSEIQWYSDHSTLYMYGWVSKLTN